MGKTFRGRVIVPGSLRGEALVTHTGFNTLACFFGSIRSGSSQAICSDQDNRELFGKNLMEKILCLPNTIGSTSAGATWETVARMGIAPKAMLFSRPIDSLAAAGLILAKEWAGKPICTIDQLGDPFLEYVKEGQEIEIQEDGSVVVD